MHPVGHQQVELLLQASWRERIQSDNHADYGRDTHGMPLLWSGTYGGRASDPRISCREKACATFDALDAHRGTFPTPEDDRLRTRAQEVPVFATRVDH